MKKWILLSVLCFLLIAGGVTFYILSQPPKEVLSKEAKEKAIAKLLGRKAQLDVAPEKTGNIIYNGKNISFEYPAKAVIYNIKEPNFASSSSLLEDFSFDMKEPRIILNLAVLDNHGRLRSIDDNPGVKFRQNSQGQYKEVSMKVDGRTGRIYERNDQEPEKTAFFLVNDKIYTISVTGSMFDEIKGLADGILKSTKFK